MYVRFLKHFSLVLLFFMSVNSYAEEDSQFLVVPNCLLSGKLSYEEITKVENLHLIKLNNLDELQAARRKKGENCRGFINVTASWRTLSKHEKSTPDVFLQRYLPTSHPSDLTRGYKIQNQAQVNKLIQKIALTKLQAGLETLTAFPDRYVNSDNGVKAADWIKQQIKNMVTESSRHDVAIIMLPTMNSRKQPTMIVKIGKTLKSSGIVIGAHLDTLNSTSETKPGADDNASGAAALLETARALITSDLAFNKPVYLIWYAGEEEGKLGSQSVVQYFNRKKIPVDVVLNLDLTGYVGDKDAGIGFADDFTDAALTAFVADLVAEYVKLPVGASHCGYACSDHVIWYQNGNRVAYPFETMEDEGNPYVHSKNDTVSKLSLDHVRDFVKLSVAFAVELAEPAEEKTKPT